MEVFISSIKSSVAFIELTIFESACFDFSLTVTPRSIDVTIFSIIWKIDLVAAALDSDKLRISDATTTNPRPSSPACAA